MGYALAERLPAAPVRDPRVDQLEALIEALRQASVDASRAEFGALFNTAQRCG